MTVRLVAFSVDLLDAEARAIGELCALLGVAEPIDWPLPFSDAGVRRWFRRQLLADPGLAPWLGHYVIGDVAGLATLGGTAGFKGCPDTHGSVEIGYALVPGYHRKGLGSAMLQSLLAQAFADHRVRRVKAETPETFGASRGLLEKHGFQTIGHRDDSDDGALVVYALARP